MEKFYRVSEAANILKISASTLRHYTNTGIIEYSRNPAGQRVFTQTQLDAFLGYESDPAEKSVVFYVRASDGDPVKLDTQEKLLREAFGEPIKVYKDKASGLNEKRPGLKSLLNYANKQHVTRVAVTQKDRLTRFGFSYLEELLKLKGVEVVVLSEVVEKTLEEELLQDFMSLLASFSGKYYRLRGHSQQKQLLDKVRGTLEEKE